MNIYHLGHFCPGNVVQRKLQDFCPLNKRRKNVERPAKLKDIIERVDLSMRNSLLQFYRLGESDVSIRKCNKVIPSFRTELLWFRRGWIRSFTTGKDCYCNSLRAIIKNLESTDEIVSPNLIVKGSN